MHKFYPYLLLFLFQFSFLTLTRVGLAQINDTTEVAYHESNESGIIAQIDSIVANAIKSRAFPGCVIYASHQDSILLFNSYGYHTYDSIRETKKDDIYDLASITKIAGATLAMMKLFEDGLIKLDEPINNYVKVGGKIGKVTIREALAHQGGIKPWIPFHLEIRKKDGSFRSKDISLVKKEGYSFQLATNMYLADHFYEKSIKKLIRRSKVVKNPDYRYSGLFFYLVPEMVERLSGTSFEQYLEDNFYGPLGAETMGFNPLDDFELSRMVPTEVDTFFRNEPIHGLVHDEGAIMMQGISGNAGLFGAAEDLSRIMRMLLHEGIADTVSYLKPQTVSLFTTAQYPNLENRRGLGFDKPLIDYDANLSSVARRASPGSFGHSGYTGTLVWVDPEEELIFIFLSNRVFPSRNNRALYELNIRPTIHDLLYDFLSSGN